MKRCLALMLVVCVSALPISACFVDVDLDRGDPDPRQPDAGPVPDARPWTDANAATDTRPDAGPSSDGLTDASSF